MKQTYKSIKTLLLLGVLYLFGQSCAFAEECVDIQKRGVKRTYEELTLSQNKPLIPEKSLCFLDSFPTEIIDHILDFLDLKEDHNTLVSLTASCKDLKALVMQKYETANTDEHHYQWGDNPTLTPMALYVHNSRMKTILGLYINICYYGSEQNDRVRFENFCHQFQQTPFFTPESLPIRYINFLRFSLDVENSLALDVENSLALDVENPLALEAPPVDSVNLLEEKKINFALEFNQIISPLNVTCQNTAALYFHYILALSDEYIRVVEAFQRIPLFYNVKSSLMSVASPELEALKYELDRTGLNKRAGQFAAKWQELMTLEPAPTIWQLDMAARSNFNFASNLTNEDKNKDKYLAKATEYYEQKMKALNKHKIGAMSIEYNTIASVNYVAGKNTQDINDKARYFSRSCKYYEEELGESKKIPLLSVDYKDMASANYEAGTVVQNKEDKVRYFIKAAEYFEEALKKLNEERKDNSDGANLDVGPYGQAAKNMTIYFAKTVEYYDERLNILKGIGKAPRVIDYSNIAQASYHVGKNTQNPKDKVKYFNTAATNYELALKAEIEKEFVPIALQSLIEIYAYLNDIEKVTFYSNQLPPPA